MRQPDGLLICDDCGKDDDYGGYPRGWNWSGVPLPGRHYCPDCRHRRGNAFLFDPRPWPEIEAALKGTAA